MNSPYRVRVRIGGMAIVASTALLVFASSTPALASGTCISYKLYDVKQVSLNGDYNSIYSTITDPSATHLPGSSTNNFYNDHILLWDGIVEKSIPSGDPQCGDGESQYHDLCWLQAGVGMGYVATSLGSDRNNTQAYEAYTEFYGTGNSPYYIHFFDGISINQDAAIFVKVFATGMGNQFESMVEDKNGTWWPLKTGDLYYAAAHGAAHSEVLTQSSATCPTLTNGTPYQHFGTLANGGHDINNEIILGDTVWSGSPTVTDADPYWLTKTPSYWPASFQTNGPGSQAAYYP